MQLHSYLIDALDRVLSWDLSDDACPEALTAEAELLAGVDPDQCGVIDLD